MHQGIEKGRKPQGSTKNTLSEILQIYVKQTNLNNKKILIVLSLSKFLKGPT